MRRPVTARVEPVDLEAGHQLRQPLAGGAKLAGGAGDAPVPAEGVADHRAFEVLAASASVRRRSAATVFRKADGRASGPTGP